MKQLKQSKATIKRLCILYRHLEELDALNIKKVSSIKIAEALDVTAFNIRKDISSFGEIGASGSGYEVKKLKTFLGEKLGLNKERKACVVGLGRLGSAILNFDKFLIAGYTIAAGFDANINRIETLSSHVPLHPIYELEEIINQKKIELAILTVPAAVALESAKRLADAGIKGIVNFTPMVINLNNSTVIIRTIDIIHEFRTINALLHLNR